MSADNGIYILQTPMPDGTSGHEYRVTEAQAIENVTYENPDGNPEMVVEYFGKCKVFRCDQDAFKAAGEIESEIAQSHGILEYGTSMIELPFPFAHYQAVVNKKTQTCVVQLKAITVRVETDPACANVVALALICGKSQVRMPPLIEVCKQEDQKMKFRKKPVVIEAIQWFKYGDHSVVKYYRHPEVPGEHKCQHCQQPMHVHGWIDTLEGGHVVCPGDWIITGVKGEQYPCKPDIFKATYEPVEEPHV